MNENEIQDVPENMVPLNKEKRKPSKAEIKRFEAREERKRRLINKGVKPENVNTVLAQQEYDELPTDRKLARLESIIRNAVQNLAQEMSNLHYNQQQLADMADINSRTVEKLLHTLNITDDQFKTAMAESQLEVAEEFKQRQAQAQRLTKEAEEKSEKEAMVEGMKASEEGAEIPPEATVFGE